MRKTTWLRAAAMSALVCGSTWQLQAELRCVYVAGADNEWKQPTTEFQAEWDNVRIWETAEGSNVYEGVLPVREGDDDIWFRFITKLSDDYNNGACWHENFVGPVPQGTIYEPTLESKSGVYYTAQLNVKEYSPNEANSWHVALPEGTREVKYHLDLNTREMWVVSDMAVMPLFNTDSKPRAKEASEIVGINRTGSTNPTYFVPKGNCTFKIYNAFTDKFGCPSSDTTIAGDKTTGYLNYNYDNSSSNKWEISGWEGGTIQFSSAMTIKIDNASQSTTLPSIDDMNYLVAVSHDDDIKIDRDNFSYVVHKFPHLTLTANGVYEGSLESTKDVRFLKKVGTTPAENVYITPGKDDRELSFRREIAYSSYEEGGEGNGYWTGITKPMNVKVDTNAAGSMAVQFGEENNGPTSLYVVGTNSDWTTPSASNFDFYQDHRIFSTTDGRYYGSIPAVKDSDGNVCFRFFSDLQGWTFTTSIGSYPEDFYNLSSETGGKQYDLYMNGLGNFSFSNYEGDRIYILLDLVNRKASFYSSPLDLETGPAADLPTISLATETGIRNDNYIEHHSVNDKLILHSRTLPFSIDEPEWMGSYLLEPADPEAKLELNKAGIARLKLKAKDGISTTPGTGISLASLPLGSYDAKIVNNNTELIITDSNKFFIVGEPTGNKELNIETAESFGNYTINAYYGTVVYIPAGKFDFSFGTFDHPVWGGIEREVEWKDGAFNFMENGIDGLSGARYCHFTEPAWQGGWVLINKYALVDLAKVDLYANKVTDNKSVQLDKKAGEDPIYSGRVDIHNDGNGQAQLYFSARNETTVYDVAGAPQYYVFTFDNSKNTYVSKAGGNEDAYFEGQKLEAPLAISSVSYKFPDVKECAADVTLNLKDMTMTLEAVDMDELQKFSIFSDDEEVDGSEAVESGTEDNVMTAAVDVPEKKEDVAVNFVTADNEVIMPASDTEVTFDEHGNYSTYYATKPAGSTTRRKAASEAHHWIIPAKYTGSEIAFRIDHNTHKLSIAAAKAVKHYYVVDGDYDRNYPEYSVFRLPELADHALKETSKGVYEGDVKLPTTKLMSIIGGNVTEGKITTPVGARYNSHSIDMKSAEDEVVMLAPYDYSVSPWEIVGDEHNGTHHLILDMNQYKLTIKKDLTNVEETFALDGMLIDGLKGTLRITSDSDTEVAVYNMQGALVKLISAQAGVTETTLPAGIYIAAGKKVMVR